MYNRMSRNTRLLLKCHVCAGLFISVLIILSESSYFCLTPTKVSISDSSGSTIYHSTENKYGNKDHTGRFSQTLSTRHVKEEMRHFWMAIKHEITELEKTKNITPAANAAVGRLSDRIRALTVDIEDLQSYDDVWKSELAAKSSNHLTKWIHQLQNPSDCETASKFYWKELEECGVGCVMHQLVRGLDHTMEKTQVLLANFNNSQYTHSGDLEDFPLLPISSCSNPINVDNWEEYICQSTYCGPKTDKMNRRSDHKLSYIKEPRITKGFAFKPAAISDEVWLEMKSFHGNPRAWISGHMLNYLMRPKPWMKKILDQHEKEIDFSTPIVGVHVRRTDKLTDVGESANFIHLREFIIHVKEWYDKYELRLKKEGKSNVVERRIFLATDDPGVWDQAEREFPEYKFLGSRQISIDASTIQSRESKNGLIGVIIDIMMLSKCDFLVCTLSSELATVAYELMQVRDWKAADNYVSLDHIYGGALGTPAKFHQAVLGHKRNNYTEELSLKFGDMLFTQMDNSSGFFYGGNNRTGKFGWYPSYKVKESTQFFSQMDKRAWEVSGGNEAKDDQGNKIKLYITFD